MARTFSGALVPAVNADGSVQWQGWQYAELLAHLNLDLQLDASAVPPTPTPVWNPIPFYGSNWHSFTVSAEWGTPSYTVDAFNTVRFTGLVSPIAGYGYNALSANILSLPPALIPTKTAMRLVFGQDSTSAYFAARLDIAGRTSVAYTPGDVRLVANVAGSNNGLPGLVALHELSFSLGTPA